MPIGISFFRIFCFLCRSGYRIKTNKSKEYDSRGTQYSHDTPKLVVIPEFGLL